MARKKRRTAAQKAATRKLVALNRSRRRKPTRRRRNPIGKMSAASRRAPIRRRRRSPAARVRRRRNPVRKGMLSNVFSNLVMPSAIGGAGGVVLDMAFGYLPIPAQYKTGYIGTVAKGATAVVLSEVAKKAGMKKATAEQIGVGMLTIIMYNQMQGIVAKMMPNAAAGLGYYSPAHMAMYTDQASSMAMYTPGPEAMNSEAEYYQAA